MISETKNILGSKVIEVVSDQLPTHLSVLRDEVLRMHQGPQPVLIEKIYSDARAWAAHSEEEDWLLLRGRWIFERLRNMRVVVVDN